MYYSFSAFLFKCSLSCDAEKKLKNFPITALLSYQEIATFACCRGNVQIEETNPRCNIGNGFPILRLLSSSAYLTDQENNVDFPTYSKNSISNLTWHLRLQDFPTFRFCCKRNSFRMIFRRMRLALYSIDLQIRPRENSQSVIGDEEKRKPISSLIAV